MLIACSPHRGQAASIDRQTAPVMLSVCVRAGVLGTAATGLILANGSWDDVWGVAVALYLVGTVVWNVFSTGEQIFD